MFSSGKTCKKYLEFPANENLARIIPLQLYFLGHSRLGTWLVVVFFDMHAPPCMQRLGVNTPCHSDVWLGFCIIMWSYALFVELNLVHSRAGHFPSWAEPCSYMLFLCCCFHEIAIVQAVLQSDLWTRLCHDSHPIKWGWTTLDQDAVCGVPSTLETDFDYSNLESQTYPMPMQWSTNTPTTSQCKQEGK